MKNDKMLIMVGSVVFLFYFTIQAQKLSDTPFGGNFSLSKNIPSLSENLRQKILTDNKKVISSLQSANKKSKANNRFSLPNFEWPLKVSTKLNNYSYYGIANFVDHNPLYPNQLLDYSGGTRSYDLETGYNHQGTDIFTWPFAWYIMDNDLVDIVAMADGVIIGKENGHYDRSCGWVDETWNAVYLLHNDGITAWYGHLKNGSLTNKTIGDTVKTGEYLGIIGSSGSSFGPHLHLEIYDSESNLIDPWRGQFNPSIDTSWWANQKPYYDSQVNKVATHSAWPVFPDCPQQEILNIKDEFEQGDTVYLITYYQDQLEGQISKYQITSPDNFVWAEWTHSINEKHLSASYWGWWFILPLYAPLGEWQFYVKFNQIEYSHSFSVKSTTDITTEEVFHPNFELFQNYPNPFNPTTKIRFTIPFNDNTILSQEKTQLLVYDILGREIATLIEKELTPGNHEIEFHNSDLPSGIYFYRLSYGQYFAAKKMILLK